MISIKMPKMPTLDFYLIKQKRALKKQQKKLIAEIERYKKYPSHYGSSDEEKVQTMEEWSENIELKKKFEAELKDVERAIGKIDKNKYGKCESCKGAIEEGRLEILPTAKLCVTCAGKR